MAQNSIRSYIGVAKEVTKGTAVVPTDFIPVSVSKLKPADIIDPLYDNGLRGSNVETYAYIPGRTRSTFDFGGPVFPDTIGYPIAGLLGNVVTTGISAPFSHAISLKNQTAVAVDDQPTAFTLTDFYAANVRAYAGCQIHDFSLKFNTEGLLEYDAKATGWLSATAAVPTPSFSTLLPVPVWQAVVTIGGVAVAYTVDGSLDMKRKIKPIYGASNTQNPYAIFVGGLTTTGKFTFVMENDAELTRYLTNTQPSISLNWTNGAGAALTQVQAVMTKGAYVAAVIERSKEFVEVVVDVNAQGNATDGGAIGMSNIKWTLQNAKPAGTYQ